MEVKPGCPDTKTYTAHHKVVFVCFVSISFMCSKRIASAVRFFISLSRPWKKYGYRPIPKIPSGLYHEFIPLVYFLPAPPDKRFFCIFVS